MSDTSAAKVAKMKSSISERKNDELLQMSDTNVKSNKNSKKKTISLMSKIKCFPTFIDLSKSKIPSIVKTTSERTYSELASIKKLLKDDDNSCELIGLFTINFRSYCGGTSVMVYNTFDNKDEYLFRILDLPGFFLYNIKSSEDIDRFLSVYDRTIHFDKNKYSF